MQAVNDAMMAETNRTIASNFTIAGRLLQHLRLLLSDAGFIDDSLTGEGFSKETLMNVPDTMQPGYRTGMSHFEPFPFDWQFVNISALMWRASGYKPMKAWRVPAAINPCL
jgi:hypothetical protein